MKDRPFSTRQGFSMLILFLVGSTVVMNPGKEAGTAVWLAMLLASMAAVPLALVYGRLIWLNPDENLYGLQLRLLGPVIGRVTGLFMAWFSLHCGAIVLREFTEFIQIESFGSMPQYFFAVPLGLLSIWCIRAGIATLGRWALIAAPLYVILLLMNMLLSIDMWDFRQLRPVLAHGFRPVLAGSAKIMTLSFLEVPLIVLICQPFQNGKKAIGMFLGSFGVAAVLLTMLFLRNLLVLGPTLVQKLIFPSFEVVGLTDIGKFIQGLGVVGALVFLIGYFVKLTVFLYGAVAGFARVFSFKDYRQIAAPIGLILITLSLLVTENTMGLLAWLDQVFPYYLLPVGLILPLALWGMSEWKNHRKSPANSHAPSGGA